MNPPAAARFKRSIAVLGGAVVIAFAVPALAGATAPHRDRPTAVPVIERDFHIKAPRQMPAGNIVLRLSNRGPDDHELLVVRRGRPDLPLRADGLTVDEATLEPRTIGVLEAGQAGTHRSLRLHLRPGHYQLFCNMSGHYLGGMHARFKVER